MLALVCLICDAAAAAERPAAGPTPGTPVPTALPVLRVGTSGDYRPFSFHDAQGTLVGFDITVAEHLARSLGRRLELVPFRWPELTSQMQAGAFDVAMSGVTVGPERALHMAFTRPYAITGAVAVIRAADRSKFDALDKLDRPDVRIVVNAGGHLEQVARQRFQHARITAITDNTALPALLLSGAADAAISEELEARTWATTPQGPAVGVSSMDRSRWSLGGAKSDSLLGPAVRGPASFVVLGPFTHDDKAYALRPDDGDLLRRVNAWLAAQEDNGWLNAQRRKWFKGPTTLTPQQVGFEALVAAMELRLQLMPSVAAVKQREHLPVHDPEQEARVLAHVRQEAAAERLNADDVATLFRAQMDAAKAVEAQTTEVSSDATLTDVRAAVARATDAIIAELGRCAPWLREPQPRRQLDRLLRRRLAATGLPAPAIDALARAVCRVRMARH